MNGYKKSHLFESSDAEKLETLIKNYHPDHLLVELFEKVGGSVEAQKWLEEVWNDYAEDLIDLED